MKVGGKDILKRTWKDLSEHVSLEVCFFCVSQKLYCAKSVVTVLDGDFTFLCFFVTH